jgi:ABC-type multidrug transport system fused ATPase/permease subunit
LLCLRLATWTTAIDEPVQRFGIIFQPQSAGNSAQYEFIKVYVIILVISFTATFTRSQWIVRGGANCAEIAFDKMLSRVIYAPMSYFETTPLGRILNRLTYDVEILDITLATSMTVLMISTVSLKSNEILFRGNFHCFIISCLTGFLIFQGWFVAGLVVQITILPWSAAALLIILVAYYLLLLYYRKSATDLQRLDAVSRSPIQACLTEGKPF